LDWLNLIFQLLNFYKRLQSRLHAYLWNRAWQKLVAPQVTNIFSLKRSYYFYPIKSHYQALFKTKAQLELKTFGSLVKW